ncbi:hypothetical protein EGW08_023747 [Elysia chlorotica]|uniref:SWIM-type domain-containing protein n=1 Tax=Elysia chlorotica TaxID=188477 RepID=A0A3S1BJ51_ELYCH|nr:hypothetical protein EGW08_023747 [Elysia chlorotica]
MELYALFLEESNHVNFTSITKTSRTEFPELQRTITPHALNLAVTEVKKSSAYHILNYGEQTFAVHNNDINNSIEVKQDTCLCRTSLTLQIPCCHVIAVRRSQEQELLPLSLFAERWHINHNRSAPADSNSGSSIFSVFDWRRSAMSKKDRYGLVKPQIDRLLHLIVEHGEQRVKYYLKRLQDFEEMVSASKNFELMEGEVAHVVEEDVVQIVEEDVAQVVEEDVVQIVEEDVAEVVEEDIVQNVEEDVAEVVEEDIVQNVEEDVAEVVEEDIVQNVEEDVAEVVEEDIVQNVEEDVAEVVEEDIVQNVEEDVAEVVEEDIVQNVEEDVAEVVEEDIVQNVEEDVAEVVEEDIVQNVEEDVAEVVEEDIVQNVEEDVAEVVEEDIVQNVEEDVAEVVSINYYSCYFIMS